MSCFKLVRTAADFISRNYSSRVEDKTRVLNVLVQLYLAALRLGNCKKISDNAPGANTYGKDRGKSQRKQ